jgi:hypothetical protein
VFISACLLDSTTCVAIRKGGVDIANAAGRLGRENGVGGPLLPTAAQTRCGGMSALARADATEPRGDRQLPGLTTDRRASQCESVANLARQAAVCA